MTKAKIDKGDDIKLKNCIKEHNQQSERQSTKGRKYLQIIFLKGVNIQNKKEKKLQPNNKKINSV